MARAAKVHGLDPDQRCGEAVARLIEARSAELERHAGRLAREGGGEALHDLRVDLRRLRTVLESFSPCFPTRARKRTIAQLKALSRALGAERDREVQSALLDEHLALRTPTERRALGELCAGLRRREVREREQLSEALATLQGKRLGEQLQALAKHARKER
jgi:CHAD domain-containing protein